jgi:hypothetical protein
MFKKLMTPYKYAPAQAHDSDSSKGQAGRDVDVALAEFAALRAEIASSKTVQSTSIGVGLTAIGAIFAFALQKNGTTDTLLVVAPFSLVINVVYFAEAVRIRRVGDYIRKYLWQYLEDRTGYPHSWEKEHARQVKRFSGIVAETLFGGAVPLLLACIGAIALLYSHADAAPAAIGWISVALTLIIPIGFSYINFKRLDLSFVSAAWDSVRNMLAPDNGRPGQTGTT